MTKDNAYIVTLSCSAAIVIKSFGGDKQALQDIYRTACKKTGRAPSSSKPQIDTIKSIGPHIVETFLKGYTFTETFNSKAEGKAFQAAALDALSERNKLQRLTNKAEAQKIGKAFKENSWLMNPRGKTKKAISSAIDFIKGTEKPAPLAHWSQKDRLDYKDILENGSFNISIELDTVGSALSAKVA